MTESILNSIKKTLNVGTDDPSFDPDIMLHINTSLSILTQVGIGPSEGFMIVDDSITWDAFLGNDPRYNMAKSFVYLNTRLLFDPPSTSFVIQSMEKQIDQLIWRLNVEREGTKWVDPFTPAA